MRAPSPAFSYYPKDIISDENCAAMTLEEFGAYHRLLGHAWLEGSIPKDKVKLARLLGVSPKKLDRIWPAIEPCWGISPDAEDRLIQRRLEEEREKQRERAAKQAENGKKGGRPAKSTPEESNGLNKDKRRDSQQEPKKSLPSPSPSPSPRINGTDLSAVADVVAFYNRITGRDLSVDTHEKFIRPRLREGVTVTKLKLATIGGCLSARHLGFNEREEVYLDPETLFKPGRLDGHADRARGATFTLERGGDVWAWWQKKLGLRSPAAVMEHFFRERDALLAAEGRSPIGPAAVYSSGYRPGDAWPAVTP